MNEKPLKHKFMDSTAPTIQHVHRSILPISLMGKGNMPPFKSIQVLNKSGNVRLHIKANPTRLIHKSEQTCVREHRLDTGSNVMFTE